MVGLQSRDSPLIIGTVLSTTYEVLSMLTLNCQRASAEMAYRKTRIVCVSDTHGYSPAEAGFTLPRGDVLIHAGDLSIRGTKPELERTFKWIEEADYEVKIVVAGQS
jgi:hypothetical protein